MRVCRAVPLNNITAATLKILVKPFLLQNEEFFEFRSMVPSLFGFRFLFFLIERYEVMVYSFNSLLKHVYMPFIIYRNLRTFCITLVVNVLRNFVQFTVCTSYCIVIVSVRNSLL